MKYLFKNQIHSHRYVAPHEGAWIEMHSSYFRSKMLSVAPHEGAWIEIFGFNVEHMGNFVAPHEGAWIEIYSR